MRAVYKVRYFQCACGEQVEKLRWDYDPALDCPVCGKTMEEVGRFKRLGETAAVHGDEIDIEIRHGICNEDGTPRRFRSKTEMRKVAYESGYCIEGETPRPNPRIVEGRAEAEAKRR